MRFQELKEQLKDFPTFTLNDIRMVERNFRRRSLNDWQDKGFIVKLRRGHYCFAGQRLSEEELFLIANRLYTPSYVSLESALSFHGLIPEGVYAVTSAATLKTASFKTPLATFSYRRIKPSLYFGYALMETGGQKYRMAEMEKAVLDYLYLHPGATRPEDFHEWRFSSGLFLEKADLTKMARYAEAFGNKRLSRRFEEFLKLIKS
jgi:predicted transcriptional regulator of viral defense system